MGLSALFPSAIRNRLVERPERKKTLQTLEKFTGREKTNAGAEVGRMLKSLSLAEQGNLLKRLGDKSGRKKSYPQEKKRKDKDDDPDHGSRPRQSDTSRYNYKEKNHQ